LAIPQSGDARRAKNILDEFGQGKSTWHVAQLPPGKNRSLQANSNFALKI
jgi:hypothetical protein